MKTYYIYTLVNPNNNHVFYIGLTTNPEQRTYAWHKDAERMIKANATTNILTPDFYKYTIKHKIVPEFEIVEMFETDSPIEAARVEVYWMWQFRSWGFEITNRSGLPLSINNCWKALRDATGIITIYR